MAASQPPERLDYVLYAPSPAIMQRPAVKGCEPGSKYYSSVRGIRVFNDILPQTGDGGVEERQYQSIREVRGNIRGSIDTADHDDATASATVSNSHFTLPFRFGSTMGVPRAFFGDDGA